MPTPILDKAPAAAPLSSPASALRLPLGWSRWQWACVVLAAAGFALLLAAERSRKEADARQTVTCEVLTRGPADGAPLGPIEVSVAYNALERGYGGFKSPAQPAGSAGQLAHYAFPVLLRGLEGLALRAPGRVETLRLYDSEDRSIARLSREHFHAGTDLPGKGTPVILQEPRDGSAPQGWGVIDRLPLPAAPGALFLAGWWAFYTAVIFGLAWMAAQLVAPGRSFDLRIYSSRFDALARLADRTRPLQLGLAVGLALAMAAVSAPNAHPDEDQHKTAARYYRDGGWLPPAVDDPAARDALGPNGLSYHQDLDVVYLLAGKVSHLTGWITAREDLALRLFNVALLAGAAGLACRRGVRASAWIFLLCPQVWYVFSYFNGDAIGLFLSALIVWQLAGRETLLQRALYDHASAPGRGIAWMGLLLGLIAVSKKNYFPLLLLAAGCAAWQWHEAAGRPGRRKLAVRWSAIFAIALAIYGLRAGYDASLYGFHKAARIREITESRAIPAFRPSAMGGPEAHWYMGLRERGVAPAALLIAPRWRAESFMSFVGMYGWMTISGPGAYYRLMQYLYLAFGAATLFEYLRGATRADLAMVALCAGLCAVSAAASVYYSWTVAFQPQGRYLFPMLPILALLGLRRPESLRTPLPIVLGGLIFAASVYSFALVGLARIPK